MLSLPLGPLRNLISHSEFANSLQQRVVQGFHVLERALAQTLVENPSRDALFEDVCSRAVSIFTKN